MVHLEIDFNKRQKSSEGHNGKEDWTKHFHQKVKSRRDVSWVFCEEQAVTLFMQLTYKANNWQKEFPVSFFIKELHEKQNGTGI